MSDEHLYRELKEQELEEDARYRQNQAPKIIERVKPKPVDYNAALRRFEREIKPVLERREKARTSKAYRLFLKVTGQWTDLDAAEAVSPTKGLTTTGMTVDELARQVQQDPEGYKHLAKTGLPKADPVPAERRVIQPKWGEDEGK